MLACSEARVGCPRVCRKNVPSRVRCVKDGKLCRKIRQCSLEEENCKRKGKNLPVLVATNKRLCRNILTTVGSGECAVIRKPRALPSNCRDICRMEPNDKPMCYRSKRNHCRLLTPCQRNRLNCLRGPDNRLEWIDKRACDGLHKTGIKQKCRGIPKSG